MLLGFAILLSTLIGIGAPIIALIGLILAVKARRNLQLVHVRLDHLETELRAARRAGDLAAEPTAAPAPAPEQPSQAAPPPPEAEAPKPVSVPAIPAAAQQPPPPRTGFEEKLGSRWAVWVGGVALALGGIFLVRYSIEQNLLSPGTRIALGGLFALALIGAGEGMRRRESSFGLPGIPSANVPSVLTAAGTCTAFASAYAAYAL
ncbi:DUF2339 domain-containing protein, partial [Microvirga sp. Mcv34]|uniref:DUF2339 domain-containing protein n=1 Tax=Microvirga sp. Mcv34 TaxID=2926016 RepID=UPI0021C922CC